MVELKKSELDIVLNKIDADGGAEILDGFSEEDVKKVRNFHKSFPEYEVTPLHELNDFADEVDVGKVWLKDESYRFGLNAFKVLGGSYAIAKYLDEKLEVQLEDLSFESLRSDAVKEELGGKVTFVTATDGNHGRGVAWAAEQLGHNSVVFMPKCAAPTRLENIKKEGAYAEITDLNYDDAVRHATNYADKEGGIVIQDTAWEGYTHIPKWIMQGYTTLIDESLEQLDGEVPTHVFLQAGVGSFAGAATAYLKSKFGEDCPKIIIVEPEKANCMYKSACEADGKPHVVKGDLDTIMAGLACGEPNPIAWDILANYTDAFVNSPDYLAANGMRILANPLGNDPEVVAGESGAIGTGLMDMLKQRHEDFAEIKEELELNEDSKVLLVSTEGDTDPVNYRNTLWYGKDSLPRW
ncbi:MAG: diaminopropionate ammonia-lyase [Bacillota bacterium]